MRRRPPLSAEPASISTLRRLRWARARECGGKVEMVGCGGDAKDFDVARAEGGLAIGGGVGGVLRAEDEQVVCGTGDES